MPTDSTKNRSVVFILETLSFFSLIAAITFFLVSFYAIQDWWTQAYAGIVVYIFLKIFTRRLIYTSTIRSNKHADKLTPTNQQTKFPPQQVMSINPVVDELPHDPVFSDQKKEQNTTSKKTKTNNADIPILTEVINEKQKPDNSTETSKILNKSITMEKITASNKTIEQKNKLTASFQCGLFKQELHSSDPWNSESENIIEVDNLTAELGQNYFTLSSNTALGQKKMLSRTRLNNIHKIAYEELRDITYHKFKFVKYLSIGTLVGIFICLWLIGLEKHETGRWPQMSFAVTTVLPILALSSFAGVLFGLLLPARSIRIYIMFTLNRKKGNAVNFIVSQQQFSQVQQIFLERGWDLVNYNASS